MIGARRCWSGRSRGNGGDEPYKFALTGRCLHHVPMAMLCICLTAFAGGILFSCGHFAVPADAGAAERRDRRGAGGAEQASPSRPLHQAGARRQGVALAGVLQLLFQWPALLKRIGWCRPRLANVPGRAPDHADGAGADRVGVPRRGTCW